MKKLAQVFLSFFVLSLYGFVCQGQRFVSFKKPYTSPFHQDSVYGQYLSNKDSNYLFILNKTEWAYFVCSYPEVVLRQAKTDGVTVIRVALEGTPYKSTLNYDLWPWGGTRETPDFSAINFSYWDQVEKRIKLAGENGIGIDLLLYFSLKPTLKEATLQKYYWQMIMKHFAKYSNIVCWEIMNEYTKNEDFQDIAGRYFYENDPFHRPVISSDGTTDDALWPTKQWMGMSIVHTCTGSNEPYDLDTWYNSIAKNVRAHGKPAFNNETGREVRHKNDDPVSRRKQSWLFNSAGCFWTFHAWNGCEGINDTSYVAPGEEFLKPLSEFFQKIRFWTLQPNYTVFKLNEPALICNTLSTPQRNLIVIYICTHKTGQSAAQSKAFLRVPDGKYNIKFIRPSNNQVIEEQQIESKGLNDLIKVTIREFVDDVAVIIQKTQENAKTSIPGTK